MYGVQVQHHGLIVELLVNSHHTALVLMVHPKRRHMVDTVAKIVSHSGLGVT